MIRRPPRSTLSSSSAASDVYKRQVKLSDPFSKSVRLALSNKLVNVERLGSYDATCGILLGVVVGVAVGVAVDVLDVVQPDTNKEATTNNRTAIAVIDFSCIIGHVCLSLIHISEPTRLLSISYAVFCL